MELTQRNGARRPCWNTKPSKSQSSASTASFNEALVQGSKRTGEQVNQRAKVSTVKRQLLRHQSLMSTQRPRLGSKERLVQPEACRLLVVVLKLHDGQHGGVDEQVESLRRLGLVKELDSYTEPVLNRTQHVNTKLSNGEA